MFIVLQTQKHISLHDPFPIPIYSRLLSFSLMTATLREIFTFQLWNGLYDQHLHLSNMGKCASEFPY